MDTVILARVEDFCIREGLLQPGAPQHLAAAVSGGADSMALLLLLRQLQPRFGYTLSACHVNHGLRGQSADRDEAFVRAECARSGRAAAGVPCGRAGPAPGTRRGGLGAPSALHGLCAAARAGDRCHRYGPYCK